MINIIFLLMISLTMSNNCNPYIRIQVSGDQDKYIPDVLLYNDENSIDTNYLNISEIPNEIQKRIKNPKGAYNKLSKKKVYIFVVEKNYLLKLIEKLEKRILTQKQIDNKGYIPNGYYKISYYDKYNKCKEGFIHDDDKLFFLKELKKIIHIRYKKDKSKLLKYKDMLNTIIPGLEYSIKHR